MNKWMQAGLVGLALSGAVVVAEQTPNAVSQDQMKQSVSVDALDFAGGSKLKDRLMKASQFAQEVEPVVVAGLV